MDARRVREYRLHMTSLQRSLRELTASPKDTAIFLLRAAVGAIFLYHGSQKWILWGSEGEGIPRPLFFTILALSIIEPIAGILTIAGIAVQRAALVFILIMASALTLKVTTNQPFESWELDFLLLAASLVLFAFAPNSVKARKPPASRGKKRR
ncbi:MAG: hypothetical protein G01um101425_582 [Candidatus Peregrinibacteria bacterium Gr01-1014_25]|nr:MAG: hypothetical protein G01um101425_582 [Candidatus Peregrinibacteria bacterium Gr01-1014_25]